MRTIYEALKEKVGVMEIIACESHPAIEWPHEGCGGAGMPWHDGVRPSRKGDAVADWEALQEGQDMWPKREHPLCLAGQHQPPGTPAMFDSVIAFVCELCGESVNPA